MKCEEQKYVSYGRFGDWHPCTNEAKYTVVATVGSERGKTIQVCGVHARKHSEQARKAKEFDDRVERSDARHERVKGLCERAGVGRAYYDTKQMMYDGVLLTADQFEQLLEKAGL